MQTQDETFRFTHIESKLRGQQDEDLPFDLNNLCNFQYSFDVLKKAIEYLSRQQRDQQDIMIDIIESLKTSTSPVVQEMETRSAKSHKKSSEESDGQKSAKKAKTPERVVEKVVVERIIEKGNDDQKDWGPLMADFDRRFETIERKQKQQEDTNGQVQLKLNDHDDAIRKLQNEIKMLKMQRPKTNDGNGEAQAADPGMSGDQLQELFDSINQLGDDLRKEMNDKFATKRDLGDHKDQTATNFADVKKRLDALEKEQNRVAQRLAEHHQEAKNDHDELKGKVTKNARDIKDLWATSGAQPERKQAPAATGNRDEDLQNLMNLINDLQDELALKENKIDANRKYDDINDRLNKLKPAGPTGAQVSDADIAKWNANCQKTADLAALVDRLKKDLEGINAEQIRADINNLNMTILTLAKQDDLAKVQAEIAKNKVTVVDLAYALKNLTARVDDLEKKQNSFEQFVRLELGKIHAEIEKLQQAIDALKKQLMKIQKAVAAGGKEGAPVTITASDGPSKEDFDKLKQQVDDLSALMDKNVGKLKDELDTKASLHDLANLQANLMDKLNELMANLENMFADKEGTRKKLAQLEKALKQLHELLKNLQAHQGAPVEDDAMFTKKYVGPVDCASCEKGIVNLNGLRAENVNWNRLPFREPTERIARYGQGFSKFLAATGVNVHDSVQMRQQSGHRNMHNASHNDITQTTDYQTKTGETFVSPQKMPRTNMSKGAHNHTDQKQRRQQMATTLQAPNNKPMYIDAQLPHVKNIHGASNQEI